MKTIVRHILALVVAVCVLSAGLVLTGTIDRAVQIVTSAFEFANTRPEQVEESPEPSSTAAPAASGQTTEHGGLVQC